MILFSHPLASNERNKPTECIMKLINSEYQTPGNFIDIFLRRVSGRKNGNVRLRFIPRLRETSFPASCVYFRNGDLINDYTYTEM